MQFPNISGEGMPKPVTFGIAPDAEAALDRLCQRMQLMTSGQAPADNSLSLGQDIAVLIGLSATLPSLPGGKWSGEELYLDENGLRLMNLKRIDGEELMLHRDALGTPTVASWCSANPNEAGGAAVFFLIQSVAGWELGLDTGAGPIQRHAIGALPPHVTWASPTALGTGAVVGVATAIIGAVASAITATQPSVASVISAPPPPQQQEQVTWHYLVNGAQHGPMPEDTLRAKLASGELPPETLVWKSPMPEWRPATEMNLVEVKPKIRFCGYCGTPIAPNMKFCGGCGAPIA